MRKFHATASFGYCNANHEEDFEFDDDMTDAEIEEEIWDWAQQFVDVSYEEINGEE